MLLSLSRLVVHCICVLCARNSRESGRHAIAGNSSGEYERVTLTAYRISKRVKSTDGNMQSNYTIHGTETGQINLPPTRSCVLFFLSTFGGRNVQKATVLEAATGVGCCGRVSRTTCWQERLLACDDLSWSSYPFFVVSLICFLFLSYYFFFVQIFLFRFISSPFPTG